MQESAVWQLSHTISLLLTAISSHDYQQSHASLTAHIQYFQGTSWLNHTVHVDSTQHRLASMVMILANQLDAMQTKGGIHSNEIELLQCLVMGLEALHAVFDSTQSSSFSTLSNNKSSIIIVVNQIVDQLFTTLSTPSPPCLNAFSVTNLQSAITASKLSSPPTSTTYPDFQAIYPKLAMGIYQSSNVVLMDAVPASMAAHAFTEADFADLEEVNNKKPDVDGKHVMANPAARIASFSSISARDSVKAAIATSTDKYTSSSQVGTLPSFDFTTSSRREANSDWDLLGSAPSQQPVVTISSSRSVFDSMDAAIIPIQKYSAASFNPSSFTHDLQDDYISNTNDNGFNSQPLGEDDNVSSHVSAHSEDPFGLLSSNIVTNASLSVLLPPTVLTPSVQKAVGWNDSDTLDLDFMTSTTAPSPALAVAAEARGSTASLFTQQSHANYQSSGFDMLGVATSSNSVLTTSIKAETSTHIVPPATKVADYHDLDIFSSTSNQQATVPSLACTTGKNTNSVLNISISNKPIIKPATTAALKAIPLAAPPKAAVVSNVKGRRGSAQALHPSAFPSNDFTKLTMDSSTAQSSIAESDAFGFPASGLQSIQQHDDAFASSWSNTSFAGSAQSTPVETTAAGFDFPGPSPMGSGLMDFIGPTCSFGSNQLFVPTAPTIMSSAAWPGATTATADFTPRVSGSVRIPGAVFGATSYPPANNTAYNHAGAVGYVPAAVKLVQQPSPAPAFAVTAVVATGSKPVPRNPFEDLR